MGHSLQTPGLGGGGSQAGTTGDAETGLGVSQGGPLSWEAKRGAPVRQGAVC